MLADIAAMRKKKFVLAFNEPVGKDTIEVTVTDRGHLVRLLSASPISMIMVSRNWKRKWPKPTTVHRVAMTDHSRPGGVRREESGEPVGRAHGRTA
jgi:hypothetical protein